MKRQTVFLPGYKIHKPESEILYLIGNGNYTFVHCKTGKPYLVSATIKALLLSLPSFVRPRKSTAVNPKHVKKIENNVLTLSDGHQVAVSRRNQLFINNALTTA